MSFGKPEVEKKTSMFAFLEKLLEWILLWVADKVANWFLSKIAPRVRKVNFRMAAVKVGRAVWRVSSFMALAVGFVFQKEVLQFINQPFFLWIGVGIVGGFAVARIYFGFRAEIRLSSFQNSTSVIGKRVFDLVIGGLGKAFYDLAAGLLPFWQNPWVFVVLGVYSLLIVDVWWMKQWFGRAVRLDNFGNLATRP